ncbi:acetolactate synthase, small subunit [Acetitomaculum ruminis DSM 5522]|uniref:Acetolactate synthase small subunit n=2 Tax=Acetitomaculum ruminis TaxID=2382 RepID=A0A1I0V3N0_9FIRM|nr:acetolactate synthase small subunit [Acetitomaculum ruminis]SFA70667.1 acetolactate synthase, small subunit [Acetitomaculum ruminis DSM 5522]
MMRKIVLSILVENTSGVLSRVSGLFSRRGYNIDSFSAGVTADSRITRMTIVTSGDEEILEQIEKQVEKLEEVLSVTKLDYMDSVFRELALVKVRSDVNSRRDIFAIADIFRAKIIDVGNDSVTIEITGTQDKLEAFLSLMKSHEILELARTGLTALSRGSENVLEVIPLLNKRYE